MTSFSDRDGYIWYDGEMVPWREATTHVLTGNPYLITCIYKGGIGSGFCKAAGGLDEAGKNLLSLLVENRRLNTAPAIAEQYEALRAAAENRVDVDVVSASELSQAQQDKLSAALAKRLGRDVRLSCSVDAELLGGAVLKAGDLVIDGSLKADLQRLASAVTH